MLSTLSTGDEARDKPSLGPADEGIGGRRAPWQKPVGIEATAWAPKANPSRI